MKILMLTPYLPFPLLSGGQIRTYNLLKKLAKKHEITLFALIKEESERQYISELEKYCKKVKVFKRSKKPFTLKNILKTAFSHYPFLVIRNHVPKAKTAIAKELQKNNYDLIHAETFYMMPHLPQTQTPILLVEQTIEYLGYESYAKKIHWPIVKQLMQLDILKIKRSELKSWQRANELVVMSEDDREIVNRIISAPKKIKVVANGVDVNWFLQKQKNLPADPTVLFVGTFKWLPNVEAVKFLSKQVWPLIKKRLPQAKLWIVGNAPTKEIFSLQKKDTSITVTGGIPDIRDAFAGSHLLAAPVFSGKGTRYKILESMAAQTPIVATSTAVEGLGITANEHALIANNAKLMAQKIINLLENNNLQKKLAKNGLKFVQENFEWDKIARKLDKIYLQYAKS